MVQRNEAEFAKPKLEVKKLARKEINGRKIGIPSMLFLYSLFPNKGNKAKVLNEIFEFVDYKIEGTDLLIRYRLKSSKEEKIINVWSFKKLSSLKEVKENV